MYTWHQSTSDQRSMCLLGGNGSPMQCSSIIYEWDCVEQWIENVILMWLMDGPMVWVSMPPLIWQIHSVCKFSGDQWWFLSLPPPLFPSLPSSSFSLLSCSHRRPHPFSTSFFSYRFIWLVLSWGLSSYLLFSHCLPFLILLPFMCPFPLSDAFLWCLTNSLL